MDPNIKIGFDSINNVNQPATIEIEKERHISSYIKVKYSDIFQEPNHLKTFTFAWSLTKIIYNFSKKALYLFLSIFVAPFFALCWGLAFALISFVMVWLFNPLFRIIQMIGYPLQSCMHVGYQVIVEPFAYAWGSIYSRFKVQHQVLPQGIEKSIIVDI